MSNTLKDTITQDIFTSPAKDLNKKIEFLLQAFSANKEVLATVQNFRDNIQNKPSYAKNTTVMKELDSQLKKYWLNAWLLHGVDKTDLPTITQYFSRYSAGQQEKLLQKLTEKKLVLNSDIKVVSPLTIAIREYKLGKIHKLQGWINNQEKINATDGERITKIFEKSCLSLPLVTAVLHKSDRAYFSLKDFSFALEHSPQEFVQYCDIFMKRCTHTYYGTQKKSMFESAIMSMTSLEFYSKESFITSQARLFLNLAEKDTQKIRNSLENIEYIISKTGKTLNTFMSQKFKLHNEGIKALFDNVLNIEKGFDKIEPYMNTDDTPDIMLKKIKHIGIIRHHDILDDTLPTKNDTIKLKKL